MVNKKQQIDQLESKFQHETSLEYLIEQLRLLKSHIKVEYNDSERELLKLNQFNYLNPSINQLEVLNDPLKLNPPIDGSKHSALKLHQNS